jgi:hypothetical protein
VAISAGGNFDMAGDVSKMPIGRIIVVAFVIVVVSILTVTLIVTGYAFYLAFQTRGAPGQGRIDQFARGVSSWLIPVLQIVLTFLAARWIGRNTLPAEHTAGLVMGVVVIIFAAASLVLFHWPFEMLDVLWFLLILAFGWLGGRRKPAPVSPIVDVRAR